MSSEFIAVVDIGKTNAKLAIVDAHSGIEVWSAKRANQVVTGGPVRELDIAAIECWLIAAIQNAPHRQLISAIVPIAHGAAAVLVDASGAEVIAPDYEDPCFETIGERYERERDAFDSTFSPSLPLGLNLGRQLFFLEQQFPKLFARVAHVLLYPQYWAWRLSEIMASEVTSLGCHTDLWLPREMRFSPLALRHNWPQLFPALRFAGDTLGTLSQGVRERTGLHSDCRVVCGIHDSNASYLQHSLDRPRQSSFAVVSSGTWTVLMANATDPGRLRAERDMLANVDAFGLTVGTARFMGGREYEAIAATSAAPDEAGLVNVLQRRAMAIPAFANGGPFALDRGKLLNVTDLSDQERAALATLYTALMTDLLLDNLGAQGDVIVDGPLAANPLFGPVLAALRPASTVLCCSARNTISRTICRLAGIEAPRTEAPTPVPPLRAVALESYRAAWRDLLPR